MARACGRHNVAEPWRQHYAANTCRWTDEPTTASHHVAVVVARACGHHNVAEAYRRHYMVNKCTRTDMAHVGGQRDLAKSCDEQEAPKMCPEHTGAKARGELEAVDAGRQPEGAKPGSGHDTAADVATEVAGISPDAVNMASGDVNKVLGGAGNVITHGDDSRARQLPPDLAAAGKAPPLTTEPIEETAEARRQPETTSGKSQPQRRMTEDDWHHHLYDNYIGRIPDVTEVKRARRVKTNIKISHCSRMLCRRKKKSPKTRSTATQLERTGRQKSCSCPYDACSCAGIPELRSAWIPHGPRVARLRALLACCSCRRASTRRLAVGALLGRLRQLAGGPPAPAQQPVAGMRRRRRADPPCPAACLADQLPYFACSRRPDFWYRRAMRQLQGEVEREMRLPPPPPEPDEISNPVCFSISDVEYCSVAAQVEEDLQGELVVFPHERVLYGRPRCLVLCALDGAKLEFRVADSAPPPLPPPPPPPPSWLARKWTSYVTLVKSIASYIFKDKFIGLIQDVDDSYENYNINSGSLFFQIKGTKFASDELHVKGSHVFDPNLYKSAQNDSIEELTQASPTTAEQTPPISSQQQSMNATNKIYPRKCLKKESTYTDVEQTPKRVSIDLPPKKIGDDQGELAAIEGKEIEQSVTVEDKQPSHNTAEPANDKEEAHLEEQESTGTASGKAAPDACCHKLNIVNMHSKSDLISFSTSVERLKESIWEIGCSSKGDRNESDTTSLTPETANLAVGNDDEDPIFVTILNTESLCNTQELSENTQHTVNLPTSYVLPTEHKNGVPPTTSSGTKAMAQVAELAHELPAPPSADDGQPRHEHSVSKALYAEDFSSVTNDYEDVTEQIVKCVSLDTPVAPETVRESIEFKTISVNLQDDELLANSGMSYNLPESRASGERGLSETGTGAVNNFDAHMNAHLGFDVNKDILASSDSNTEKKATVNTEARLSVVASSDEHEKSNASADLEAGAAADANAGASGGAEAAAGSSALSQRAGLHLFNATCLHRQRNRQLFI